MRKKQRIAVFLFIFSAAAAQVRLYAYSLFPNYSIEMGTAAGILSGVSKELVYTDSGSDTLLSELDWAVKPLAYWGIRFDISPNDSNRSGAFAKFTLKSGIAGNTGSITDTDWLNYDGVKTHFSEHDCYTEQALLADAQAGWTFPIGPNLSLRPYIGFSYMHFRWTARDGYYQYAAYSGDDYDTWSSALPKVAVHGTGMSYEQKWLSPLFGLDVSWKASDRWNFTAAIAYSPWIGCADQDDHYLTGYRYNDTTSGSFSIEPKLEAAFRLSDPITLLATSSFRFIHKLRGDIATSRIGTSDSRWVEKDMAGVAYSAFDVSVSLSVKL